MDSSVLYLIMSFPWFALVEKENVFASARMLDLEDSVCCVILFCFCSLLTHVLITIAIQNEWQV